MATTTIVVEEDSGMESLSSCNEQQVPMENFVTLFIVVLNRKGEFDDAAEEEVLQQLRLFFDASQTVWRCKQRILANLLEHTVRDPLNYGLYCPAANGRAGKFLDEERLLREYGLSSPAMLEFKYKRRVYKMMSINQRKLRQLHSKSTLRQFIDYVRHNNVERVNRLLMSGLDPNFCDPETGETPLGLSVSLPKPYDMICALFNGGAHVDFRGAGGLTPVHKAARCAAPVSLRTLLELGAAANYRDQRGLTPLYHAVCQPRADLNCVDMLLRDRAQLNVRDEQQNTEVHQASRGGHSAIVEHLLYYGSIADAQNAIGNTALHLAAIEGHEAVVRVLLFRGAQKDLRNSAQNTPYEVAVLAGHLEIAKIIANHGPGDVVPYRDSPVYTQRRLLQTPARMPLSRSSSDNRLAATFAVVNANGANLSLASAMSGSKRSFFQAGGNSGPISLVDGNGLTSANNSTGDYASSSSPSTNGGGGGIYYATRLAPTGELAISGGSMSAFSTTNIEMNNSAVADFAGHNQSVLGPGEEGMFEGQDAETGRRGYFPSRCVREVGSLGTSAGASFLEASLATNSACEFANLQKTAALSGTMSLRHRSRSAATLYADELLSIPRTVVIQRTPAGFGFVLKGPRASQPGQTEIDFVPTPNMPATQYLAVVESGSVADRAGLKPKDYVLEIDGIPVSSATHERCVDLIRASSDMLQLKVITINSSPNCNGGLQQQNNTVLQMVENGDGSDGSHGRPPRPWQFSQSPQASTQPSNNGSLIRQPMPPPPQGSQPFLPQTNGNNLGVMTLSRHPQLRHLAPVEQLEMSLRSQLTLPRQPKIPGNNNNGCGVLRNSVTGNALDMSIHSLVASRRSISASNEQQQQRQPQTQEPQVQDLESDYETIDDAGCVSDHGNAPIPPPPASSTLLAAAVRMNGSRNGGPVSSVDNEEATYSSQLEQMDSGNSSCSNNNDEVASGGTLYANAGQLRRLYGVDETVHSCSDEQSPSSTHQQTGQQDQNGEHFVGNDDANYDTLVESVPVPPASTTTTIKQLPPANNNEDSEDIYENDTTTVDDGSNLVTNKDSQNRSQQQSQRPGVKASVSFSARAEETRRAFLDQLQQRPGSNNQNRQNNNVNNSASAQKQAPPLPPPPVSSSSSSSSSVASTNNNNNNTNNNNNSYNSMTLSRRQEAVFIAEF